MEELVEAYPDAQTDNLDGVPWDRGAWWCNVRPSNTEPMLRLNLEAADGETVKQLVKEVSRHLGKRVAH